MTPRRYQQLKSLFLEAAPLAQADRVAFLDERCGDDDELRRDVQRLLDRDEGGSGEGGDGGLLGTTHLLPTEIGEYRIDGVLGVGGMGVVYRARQQSPQRHVALKVIHPGLITPRLLRRFEREAEVLGRLRHPAIAQIHEASTWEGRPFLVMELVDGVSITAYAERHDLDVPARLGLLIDVCEAVHHAHLHGVVHRDLKPANVLVTPEGQVKVLDFGVARATEGDLDVTTMRTGAGELVGTLPYMSPEQVAADPSAIDARSDIYSLGVLGFELLAKRLPHDVERRSVPEAARIIRDEEPTRLGTLDRRFRGDLETVIGKTLEKDPRRRYQSTAELAGDLRRVVGSQPITARPPSVAYRVGKFARRNPALVTGLAVAFVVLLAASAVSTGFAVHAVRQQRQAESETAKLRAVTAYLEEMLRAANPEESRIDAERPIDVRVIDVVDWAAEHLAAGYGDQPEVEARLRTTLGTTYGSLAASAKAQAQLRIAWELWREHAGADHPETLRAAARYGGSFLGHGGTQESYREAEGVLRGVLPLMEARLGLDHEDTVGCLNHLMGSLYYQRRLDEAEDVAREAAERSRSLDEDDERRLMALNNLATVHWEGGRFEECQRLYAEIVRTRRRMQGPDHPSTVFARSQWVAALRGLGRRDEAVAVQQEVVDATGRIYGEGNAKTLFARNNLAILLREAGRPREAIDELAAVVRGYEALRIADTGFALIVRNNLVSSLIEEGELERAEVMARETLEFWERAGDHVQGLVIARYQLGLVLHEQGADEAAEPLLERAWRDEGLLADRGRAVRIGRVLARCRLALGRFDDAESLLLEDHRTRRDAGDEAGQAEVAELLAELYEAWDRPDEAAVWRAAIGDG